LCRNLAPWAPVSLWRQLYFIALSHFGVQAVSSFGAGLTLVPVMQILGAILDQPHGSASELTDVPKISITYLN
uniref:Uncharacterized protein n=1 Tax=Romanomermis culicivorax TaxID=13658 RepID=A0A915HMJ0_ROMCU